MSLATLPHPFLREVCVYLAPLDVLHLSGTCRDLFFLATDDAVWKEKYELLSGHPTAIERLLNASGLQFMETEEEEGHYRSKYAARLSLAIRSPWSEEGAIQEGGEEERTAAAEALTRAIGRIQSYQQTGKVDELQLAAEEIIHILDNFPEHPGCYHLLGMVAFLSNAFTPALTLLRMGADIDPEYESITELMTEITGILDAASAHPDGTPLVEGQGEPTPAFVNALTRIFGNFDADGDGAWSEAELSAYVRFTNGASPPPGLCRQMAANFGGNDRGYLSLDGFISFYLAQTEDEPLETRKDLAKLGFDPRFLELVSPSSST